MNKEKQLKLNEFILDTKIQPLTKQLLDGLSGSERHHAIQMYHKWLKDVRKQDYKCILAEKSRIHRFHSLNIKLTNRTLNEFCYYHIYIIIKDPYYGESIAIR